MPGCLIPPARASATSSNTRPKAAWPLTFPAAPTASDQTDCRQTGAGHGLVSDAWLSHPPGSDERDLIYHALKGDLPFDMSDRLDVEKQPERVQMQEAGGTFSRFAILGLICVGLLG